MFRNNQFVEEQHPRKGGKFVSKGGVERGSGKVKIHQNIGEQRRRLYQEMTEGQRRNFAQALIELHREQNQPKAEHKAEVPKPKEGHQAPKEEHRGSVAEHKGTGGGSKGSVGERLEHFRNQVGHDAAIHMIQKLSVERLSHEQLGHLAEAYNAHASKAKFANKSAEETIKAFRSTSAFKKLDISAREEKVAPRILHPADYTAPKKFGC